MTSPTHPKAPLYLRIGIFDGLKRFVELEARISALATVRERDDAFEVFAEAYLATVASPRKDLRSRVRRLGGSVPP